MKTARYLYLGLVCLLLLTTWAVGSPPESRGKSDADRLAHELARLQGEGELSEDALDAAFAAYGFTRIPLHLVSDETVGASSVGSDLQSFHVSFGRKADGTYQAFYSWNWKDYAWDYWNGPNDVVSLTFETIDGEPLHGLNIGNNHVLYAYWKDLTWNGCNDGWVHDISNSKKGVIFRYQDYTNVWGTDMCGDRVSGYVEVLSIPSTRPIKVRLIKEHNWKSGEIKSISLEAGGKDGAKLKVDYSVVPDSWQRTTQYEYR